MLPGEQTAEAKTARKPRAKKTALMYAVDLLARQEQSSAKLREKLLRKGYALGRSVPEQAQNNLL